MCRWDAKYGTCNMKCSLEHSSASPCNNDDVCLWNVIAGMCQPKCDRIYSKPECVANYEMCRWDSASSSCAQRCKYRYNTSDACNRDLECEWSGSRNGCKVRCTKLQSTDECYADPDCMLAPTSQSCRRKCASLSVSECYSNDWCETASDTCVLQCVLAFPSQARCDASDNCMWDSSTESCARSCETLNLLPAAATKLASMCTAQSMCQFNETTQKCSRRCRYSYFSEGSCKADAGCMWDPAGQQCHTACEGLSVTVCMGASMCQWSMELSSCKRRCRFRYATSAQCNGDPDCLWDGTACQQSCTQYSISSTCSADLMCTWDSSTGTCSGKCALQYTTRKSCMATSRCMWDPTVGGCRKECTTISDRPQCEADTMCSWRSNGTCGHTCATIYYDQVSCNRDLMCMWDVSDAMCLESCTNLPVESRCMAVDICRWNRATSSCRMACSNRIAEAACGSDALCVWRQGANGTYECREQCEQRHTTVVECNADQQCMYSTTSAKCTESCSLRSPAACVAESTCEMELALCVTKCAFAYSSRDACDAQDRCEWDVVKGTCNKKCKYITNRDLCSSNSACQWAAEECHPACTLLNATSCASMPTCTYNPTEKVCVAACNSLVTQEACSAASACQWFNGKCIQSCSVAYGNDMTNCKLASPRCEVNPNSGLCIQSCDTLTTSGSCLAYNDVCEWNGASSKCSRQCRYAANSSLQCGALRGCSWTSSGICDKDCETIGTATDCASQSRCSFYGGQCVPSCESVGANGCSSELRCQLVDTPLGLACTTTCGMKYSTAATCGGDSNCMWDSKNAQCRKACSSYNVTLSPGYSFSQIRDACVKESQCEFVGGQCLLKCEYAHTNERSCIADVSCMWDPTHLVCAKSCEAISGQTTCTANQMCEWIPVTQSCRTTCEYRHKSATNCINDNSCAWVPATKQCTSACSNRAIPEACASTSLCEWKKGACSKKCTAAHLTAEDCNSDQACQWAADSGVCKTACTDIVLSAECAESGTMCMWDEGARVCRKKCETSAVNVTSCASFPYCFWDATKSACTLDCNRTFAQAPCMANHLCQWDPSQQLCSRKCSEYTTAAECTSNKRCLAETVNGQMTCVDVPDIRFPTEMSCASNPMNDTMWDPVEQVCKQACMYLASCTESRMCVSVDGLGCTKRCEYAYIDATQCSVDNRCYWDNDRRSCVSQCTTIKSIEQCQLNPTCQWEKGSCTQRCVYHHSGEPACNANEYCTFNNVTKKCENTCEKVTQGSPSDIAQRCEAAPFCFYNITQPSQCQKQCALLSTQVQCANDPSCMWDIAVAVCKKTCKLITTKAACGVESSMCMYDDTQGVCVGQCKGRLASESACRNDSSNCQWDTKNGVCKSACGQLFFENVCRGSSECEWANGKCVRQCTDYSVQECTALGADRCVVLTAGFNGDNSFTGKKCAKGCSSLYSTSAACSEDPNCMWSTVQGTCQTSCGRTAWEHRDTEERSCNSSSACEYSSTLGCVPKCVSAYLTEPSCNENPSCMWDALRQKCGRRCTVANNMGDCTSSGLCVWNAVTSSCKTQCAYRAFTAQQCQADSECVWAADVAQCKSKCVATTQGVCTQTSTCEWSNQSCVGRCQTQCVTEACCASASGCMFDYTTGQCTKACSLLSTAECQQQSSMCTVDGRDGSCAKRCQLRYNSSVSCNSDSQCMFESRTGTCKQDCGFLSSALECTAQTMCTWDASINLCRKKCENILDRAACAAFAACDWDDKRTETKCQPKCVHRTTSEVACNADNECMWDAVSAQCTDSCSRLEQGACSLTRMCTVQVVMTPVCQRRCQYRHQTEESCSGDAFCEWDSKRLQCFDACGTLEHRTACESSPICEWRNQMCREQCFYRSKTKSQCDADSNCKWNPYSGVCSNTCDRHLSVDECAADSLCEWSTTANCTNKCANLEANECRSVPQLCMWDSSTGVCKTTCKRLSLGSLCNSEGMCLWSGSNCQLQCKYRHGDQDTCDGDETCMWTSAGVCSPSCSQTSGVANCATRKECEYDELTSTCAIKCSQRRTVSQCSHGQQCVWQASTLSCESSCTASFTTQASCNGNAQCMWNAAASSCQPSCASADNQQECVKQEMCQYLNRTCERKCTYRFTDENACLGGGCSFDTDRMTCYTKCSTIGDPDGCHRDPLCLWDSTLVACVPSCTQTYVAEASCILNARCKWDANRQRCVHACSSRATPTNCSQDSDCEWDASLSQCLTSCTSGFATKESCVTQAGSRCMWDSAVSTCKRSCSLLGASGCISEPSMCLLDAKTGLCALSCVQKYGTDLVRCMRDSSCTFDATRNVCTASCEQEATSLSCTAKPMCQWNVATATCSTKCELKALVSDCSADTQCEMRGGTCTRKCVFKYTTALTCNLDTNCMWSVSDGQCRETCSSLTTPSLCAAEKMCEYTTTACSMKCAFRHLAESNCTKDLSCFWDYERLACTQACTDVTSMTACYSLPHCQYDNGACTYQCKYAKLDTSGKCAAAAARGVLLGRFFEQLRERMLAESRAMQNKYTVQAGCSS